MQYGGQDLWPGEIFEPTGQKNDYLLFKDDSRYVSQVINKETWPCDRCGKEFATEGHLRSHQRATVDLEKLTPAKRKSNKEKSDVMTKEALEGETMADVAGRHTGRNVAQRGKVATITN